MLGNGPPDHKHPALQRYKNELKMKVDAALGVVAPVPIEVKQPEKPKEEAPIIEKPKEEVKDSLQEMMAEAAKPIPVIKKPRAFVAEPDLFDFSDVKIVTGGEQIPKATEDKKVEKPK